MHPQLAATLLGRPLPPQPGESGATFEPERLPLVEPRTGNQAAECQHVWSVAYDAFNDPALFCIKCFARHFKTSLGGYYKHGALTAVAGRMFRR